jgi:hypothetical protein
MYKKGSRIGWSELPSARGGEIQPIGDPTLCCERKYEGKAGRLKVGIVMIKCPQTGRAIPTGIIADRESFRCSAVFFARTHCAICQTNHEWFAKEAWVYEPS